MLSTIKANLIAERARLVDELTDFAVVRGLDISTATSIITDCPNEAVKANLIAELARLRAELAEIDALLGL